VSLLADAEFAGLRTALEVTLVSDRTPAFAVPDVQDRRLAHAEIRGDGGGCNPVHLGRPDLSDLNGSQLRIRTRFASTSVAPTLPMAISVVVGACSKKQMGRVAARWIIAAVKHAGGLSGRLAVCQDVGDDMSQRAGATVDGRLDAAIATKAIGSPRPTRIGASGAIHFRPEPVGKGSALSVRAPGIALRRAELAAAFSDVSLEGREGRSARLADAGDRWGTMVAHQVTPGVSPRPLTRCGGTLRCNFTIPDQIRNAA
jgi:hypothetical protein